MTEQETDPHQSIFNPHTCTRRGMCPITKARHQREPLESCSLYFEVHGNGPQKIVLIMGLGNSSLAWVPQVEHFGKLDKYSTLIFDNRGVGFSGAPWGPYSTSGMAEDTLCLLDYLQWTDDHSLHVVGVSLGGMIAQELACRIPSRIISLSLVVTRAGGNICANTPSLAGCLHLARLFTTADPDARLALVETLLLPNDWLDSPAENDPDGRTNREVQRKALRRRMKLTRPQTLIGALSQIVAALTHSMTPDQLAKVSASVPKVLILSAAEDRLIPHIEGRKLRRYMLEAEYQCWKKAGHGVSTQYEERFNQLLEKVFDQGNEAAGRRVHLDSNVIQ